MVKKFPIIREIFKGDHNTTAARKLKRKQISALSGMLNYSSPLRLGIINKLLLKRKGSFIVTVLNALLFYSFFALLDIFTESFIGFLEFLRILVYVFKYPHAGVIGMAQYLYLLGQQLQKVHKAIIQLLHNSWCKCHITRLIIIKYGK